MDTPSSATNNQGAELDMGLGRKQLALLMALVDTLNLLELGEVEKAKANLRQLTGQETATGGESDDR